MPNTRWYRAEVREGSSTSHVYFWRSPEGHATRIISPESRERFYDSLDEARDAFRRARQEQHDLARDGVQVEVTDPVPIDHPDVELAQVAGLLGPIIERAEKLLRDQSDKFRNIEAFLKGRNEQSAFGAGHAWDLSRGPRNQPVLTLRIFDRFGVANHQFTPQELRDESTIERRLFALWGDLLDKRLDVLIKPIRESVREHEGV